MMTKHDLADVILQFPDSFMEDHKKMMQGFLEDTELNKEIRDNVSTYSEFIKQFAEKLRVADISDDEAEKALHGLMDYLNICSMIFCEGKVKESEALQAKLDSLSYEEVAEYSIQDQIKSLTDLSTNSINLQSKMLGFFSYTRMMFMELMMTSSKDQMEEAMKVLEEMDDDDLAEAFDGVDLTDIDDPDDDLVIQFAEPYGEVETSKSNLGLFEKVMGTTYKELDEYLR